jgi:hypothetical protein
MSIKINKDNRKKKERNILEEILFEKEYEFEYYFDDILNLYYKIYDEYTVLGFLNKSNFIDFYNVILDNIILEGSINNMIADINEDYSSDHSVED